MLAQVHLFRRGWLRAAAVALVTVLFLALPPFYANFSLKNASFQPPAAAAQVHTVKPGESIWLISRQYGVTMDALQRANGLHQTTIWPGQQLTIPGSAAGAAVQAGSWLTPAETDLMARLVRAEAEDQPYAGKVAVAAVVLNRMRSGIFPNDVRAVIYEPYQFEPVLNGAINLPARSEDRQAVMDALAGWDPSNGALFFFNPAKVTNQFLWARPATVVIGGHRFTL